MVNIYWCGLSYKSSLGSRFCNSSSSNKRSRCDEWMADQFGRTNVRRRKTADKLGACRTSITAQCKIADINKTAGVCARAGCPMLCIGQVTAKRPCPSMAYCIQPIQRRASHAKWYGNRKRLQARKSGDQEADTTSVHANDWCCCYDLPSLTLSGGVLKIAT